MEETFNLETRKEILGWFLTHPTNLISAAELAAISNGRTTPQRAQHHLLTLSGEGKLEKMRHQNVEKFKLSSVLARPLMKAVKKPGVVGPLFRTSTNQETTPNNSSKTGFAPLKDELNFKEETPEIEEVKPEEVKPKGFFPYNAKAGVGVTKQAIYSLFEMEPAKDFTIKEIAEVAGITEASSSRHLKNLIFEGKLVKYPRRANGSTHYFRLNTEANKKYIASLLNEKDESDEEESIFVFQESPTFEEPETQEVVTQKPLHRNPEGITRLRILEHFKNNPNEVFTAQALSKIVDVATQTVNFHLLKLLSTNELIVVQLSKNKMKKTGYKLHPSKTQTSVPEVVVKPAPAAIQSTSAEDLFLKSIKARLASGQPLNEYENAMLLEHLNKS
jgi:predicted ArsR family transcriptional regulator